MTAGIIIATTGVLLTTELRVATGSIKRNCAQPIVDGRPNKLPANHAAPPVFDKP